MTAKHYVNYKPVGFAKMALPPRPYYFSSDSAGNFIQGTLRGTSRRRLLNLGHDKADLSGFSERFYGGTKRVVFKGAGCVVVSDTHKGKAGVKNLPGREYIDLGTGEVRQRKQKSSCDARSARSLSKTLRDLSDRIEYNATQFQCLLHVVLTYAREPEWTNVNVDLNNFFKKLVTSELAFPYDEKIVVVDRGRENLRVHYHIVFFRHKPFNGNSRVLEQAWTHGAVKVVENVYDAAGLARYLSANIYKEYMKSDKDKNFHQAKFTSFMSIPRNVKIVRYSRGIKRPPEMKVYVSLENIPANFKCTAYASTEVYADLIGRPMRYDTLVFRYGDKKCRGITLTPGDREKWEKARRDEMIDAYLHMSEAGSKRSHEIIEKCSESFMQNKAVAKA